MKLEKIYFDAYKSLLNKTLNVTYGCIGFVGINESGKTNLLEAISILGNNKKLKSNDTPRMSKAYNPKIRFEFKLTKEEKRIIKEQLISDLDKHSLIKKLFKGTDLSLILNVEYDKHKKDEIRYFTLNEIELNDNILIRKNERDITDFKVLISGKFLPLSEINLIEKNVLETQKNYLGNCKKLDKIKNDLIISEKELNDLLGKTENNNTVKKAQEGESLEVQKESKEILEKRKEIEILKKSKNETEEKIGEYNLYEIILINKQQLEKNFENIEITEKSIENVKNKINELEKITPRNPQQNALLNQKQTEIKKSKNNLDNLAKERETLENLIQDLEQDIEEKFTDDINELKNHFSDKLINKLSSWLPNVVYWEHSDSYILESNTQFEEILEKSSLAELSRPLVNVFRICLGIKNMDELKKSIEEIRQDENERTRLNDTFNRKFGEFLDEVWSDYDQKIKISLEEHQIRIQFFDPECISASYYSMHERSQGCQTFISFLLTIGAEAKKDVLKNTVLLLDEPETHLHPSGVRYMLNELIKISENNNIVLYATHSIFMIDRNNFNRHIILIKEKELTEIVPSTNERIGFFLQEEVLYGALNINLSKDFKSSSQFNFVLEGDGDAILFQHFYEKILSTNEKPFQDKYTSFYHGGGCKGITKYFNTAPIHLGTKWIIILDKDDPADKLRKIVEGRYKDYLKKDVFVFQYEKNNLKELEMEDILPKSIIVESYIETLKTYDDSVDISTIEKLVDESEPFFKYNQTIIEKFSKSIDGDFKALFKELLNKRIKKELENNKSKADFSKNFSEYEKWANGMIKEISDGVK